MTTRCSVCEPVRLRTSGGFVGLLAGLLSRNGAQSVGLGLVAADRCTLIEDSGRSRGADHHPRQETPGSVPGTVPACSGDVGEVAMPTVDLFVRWNFEASISKMSSALFG